jgi:hypothetical protein
LAHQLRTSVPNTARQSTPQLAQEDGGVKIVTACPRHAQASHDCVFNAVIFEMIVDARERGGKIHDDTDQQGNRRIIARIMNGGDAFE